MPYVITTRTPPTTGDMACCHSTIGAGRCGHMIEQDRRAATTLDEARATAELAVIECDRLSPHRWGRDWQPDAHRIPESGGTIGPLPDGTVIEVEKQ